MLAAVEMFGRVLVAGVIAAADVPACQAHAQVHPLGAHLQAFLAAGGAGRDVADGVEMRAFLGQRFLRGYCSATLVMRLASRASRQRPSAPLRKIVMAYPRRRTTDPEAGVIVTCR